MLFILKLTRVRHVHKYLFDVQNTFFSLSSCSSFPLYLLLQAGPYISSYLQFSVIVNMQTMFQGPARRICLKIQSENLWTKSLIHQNSQGTKAEESYQIRSWTQSYIWNFFFDEHLTLTSSICPSSCIRWWMFGYLCLTYSRHQRNSHHSPPLSHHQKDLFLISLFFPISIFGSFGPEEGAQQSKPATVWREPKPRIFVYFASSLFSNQPRCDAAL